MFISKNLICSNNKRNKHYNVLMIVVYNTINKSLFTKKSIKKSMNNTLKSNNTTFKSIIYI